MIDKQEINDFDLLTTTGRVYNIYTREKDYVLMTFWATWCYYCVEELPMIQRLYDIYKNKIDFILVNCGEDKNTVDAFLKKKNFSFQVGYDIDNVYTSHYKILGIPRTIILGKENNVYADITGLQSFEEIDKIIKEIEN